MGSVWKVKSEKIAIASVEMRKLLISLFALLSLGVSAQDVQVRRGNCLPEAETDDVAAARSLKPRKLPVINRDWNPDKVYKQPVILITFSKTNDTLPSPCLFAMDNPRETYNRMFNEAGYNQRAGKGCVADYYRDQSNGMFNLVFDVYGPYMVDTLAKQKNATSNTHNYGRAMFIEATNKWIAENPTLDYKQYDWNGNGKINQVIYVCAGLCGNQNNVNSFGYIWPNTSTFSTITAPDGTKISDYTSSCETWANGYSCGIGTICHEFTHSLGLPDVYPVGNDALPYSMMDEWELMDGGNFTNYGWCPPNLTPLEKMLMGWLTPTELTGPTSIKDLKPSADGGAVYQIKHTDTEYLLLENRQWSGWDAGLPGKGLVVYHVNYNESKWANNKVNGTLNNYGYSLVSADNMNYDEWYNYVVTWKTPKQYANSYRMNSNFLSTASYPWATDSTEVVNRELTDTSVPAALMYTENGKGSTLLGKPITNITMSDDGLVSFDFMGGNTEGIENLTPTLIEGEGAVYDLQGRRINPQPSTFHHQLRIIRHPDGTVKKVFQ